MKIYQLIIIFFSILSCNTGEEKGYSESTAVSTLLDITDKHALIPDETPILNLYNMKANKDHEAIYRCTYTTDKAYNPVGICILKSKAETDAENTTDDVFHREKCVLNFYEGVKQEIKQRNTESSHDTILAHSECLKTIAMELHTLTELRYKRKFLLVYSDLSENSRIFNCYKMGNDNPELLFKKVAKVFSGTQLLPKSLTGITIYFIYQPKDRQEDTRYQIMSDVYRRLLEERGATVIITTTSKTLQS